MAPNELWLLVRFRHRCISLIQDRFCYFTNAFHRSMQNVSRLVLYWRHQGVIAGLSRLIHSSVQWLRMRLIRILVRKYESGRETGHSFPVVLQSRSSIRCMLLVWVSRLLKLSHLSLVVCIHSWSVASDDPNKTKTYLESTIKCIKRLAGRFFRQYLVLNCATELISRPIVRTNWSPPNCTLSSSQLFHCLAEIALEPLQP